MKKAAVLIVLVCALGTFLCPAVLGASQDDVKPFSVEGIGASYLPGAVSFSSAVGTETMVNLGTQYDLTGSDVDTLHYARLVAYKDTHNLGSALAFVEKVGFRPELVALLSKMGQDMAIKKLEDNGGKLVEWLPAQTVTVQQHNGVLIGARVVLSEKLPIPMFASVAVYPEGGSLNGIALICPDSDRLYWQPVFTKLLAGMI